MTFLQELIFQEGTSASSPTHTPPKTFVPHLLDRGKEARLRFQVYYLELDLDSSLVLDLSALQSVPHLDVTGRLCGMFLFSWNWQPKPMAKIKGAEYPCSMFKIHQQ